MKRHLTNVTTFLLLLRSGASTAQHTVSGVVYDAGDHTTLPGVNVIRKGTNQEI